MLIFEHEWIIIFDNFLYWQEYDNCWIVVKIKDITSLYKRYFEIMIYLSYVI